LSGGPVESTTQVKFGVSSLYFNTYSNIYMEIADSSELQFPTGDFTIDFWFWPTDTRGSALFHRYHSIGIYRSGGGYLQGFLSSDGAGYWDLGSSAGSPNDNQWNHIAMVRNGGSTTLYVNGVGTVIDSSNPTLSNGTQNWRIGNPSDNSSGGYYDEVRISKMARWTSNFTPPSEAYGAIGGPWFSHALPFA